MSTSPERIRLTAEQRERLARLADETGKPWDEVLDGALSSLEVSAAMRNGKESVYDAMVRLGLLGCVKDAPPDLSTNPAYMEGFGEHGR